MGFTKTIGLRLGSAVSVECAAKGRSTRALYFAGAAFVGLANSGSALAQEGSAQAEGAEQANGNTIIVTARRSEESLFEIGASISAVSADSISPGQIEDVESLARAIPNVSVGDQFGVNRVFIRGIGMTSIDLGADGAVAMLQDGVIIARPAAQLAGFYDVERVEVLRGPQGTLYGRGATAGAMNIVTKKPTEELEGYVRATYGNYDALTLEGAVGGPVSGDQVMVRLAGKYDKRDGYGVNLVTGEDVDDRDAFAVRGSLLARLSSNLDLTLQAEYYREDDNNYAFHYFGPTVAPENALGSVLGGDTIITYYEALGEKPNFRNGFSDQEAINDRKGYNFTGELNLDAGDWNVKSITSYRYFDRFQRDDLDASDVNMFGQNNYYETSKTFSQEFVANYDGPGFDLLLGAMYFHEDLFGQVLVPLTNLGLLFGLPADTFDDQAYNQEGDVTIDAYGLFAQGTVDLSDRLKATFGGRLSYEKRRGTGSFEFLGVVPTDRAKSWTAFTPTFSLEYQASDSTLLYASVTRGFKSGVINVGSQNEVINPEFVWGYEAGVKTAVGRLFEGSLAAFYLDYTDLQVGFVDASSVVTTVNAASARNYGLELEMRARPAPGLTLEFFGTYLNAKYKDFVNGDYRQGFAQVDLSGNRLQNAPEFSARGAISYDWVMANDSRITVRSDVNWQDRVFFTEFNNDDATQPAHAIWNAGIGYASPGEKYTVDLWVRNITDELVIANNIITAPLYNSVRVGSLAPPRTYGVTVGVNF
ncbi:TonB-dependent receptor [Altererythrobacter sp. BO-6]|uniref:TonB-dependent receptor n=1 Tax=Altererythrobacter sp. BO-6 TaxID=2604537 RepID=UPI0013E173FA|nr:TonB-dependent receptor [Altererythrobacter sp. BO-6]QIG54755.1 TonB-dependent receptor [Altererythrobacter sp. BO-6]